MAEKHDPAPMDAAEFSQTVEYIGWSLRELGRRLGISETAPRQWASGRRAVPPALALWLRMIASMLRQIGMPAGWRSGAAPDEERQS
jgi:transcriptional regulator with XRE-family HTH domain